MQFRRVFRKKQRRVELKSVGNFVVTTVLVERQNQFSQEELCTVQLEIFFDAISSIRLSGKSLASYSIIFLNYAFDSVQIVLYMTLFLCPQCI